MNIEVVLAVAGVLGAIIKWLYEYVKEVRWEKNKYLLDQIQRFNSLKTTQAAQSILDWNGIEVEIEGERVYVDNKILFEALQTHDVKYNFTEEEVLIRSLFDDYFDDLTQLVFMTRIDLISRDNLILFTRYWLDILSGEAESKPTKLVDQIHNYLSYYGYTDLLKFLYEQK